MSRHPRPPSTPAQRARKRAEWTRVAYLEHHAGRLSSAALRELLKNLRRA